MPKKDEEKIEKTMRKKRARGEKITDPDAYKYGTLEKIRRRRAAKRKK